jgi:hypothetical protein
VYIPQTEISQSCREISSTHKAILEPTGGSRNKNEGQRRMVKKVVPNVAGIGKRKRA